MKHIKQLLAVLITIAIGCTLGLAQGRVHVRTYTRKNGTVVQSHNRTQPDAER